jgi:hypothetical protein
MVHLEMMPAETASLYGTRIATHAVQAAAPGRSRPHRSSRCAHEEIMADKDNPTRSSSLDEAAQDPSAMEKPEGDRWTSDPDTVEVATRYSEGIGDVGEGTGCISNRPLPEEVERQRNLPERGKSRDDEEQHEGELGEGELEP